MLVLSRKCGERVLIGDGIRVTIVSVSPGAVRIGIEAPREVPVFREELIDPDAVPLPPLEPRGARPAVSARGD